LVIEQRPKTDAELAELDVAAMLRHGLADLDGPAGQALFSEGAVAAAIVLDQLEALPRSVTYLAEVVRHGGLRYALQLPEPLPAPSQAEIVRSWLTAAEEASDDIDGDRRMARWCEAVASILAMRRATSEGLRTPSPRR
jgi:hypothetical protein